MSHKEIGVFFTPHASKYLQQLCKHFAHKVDTSCDTQSGLVKFPMGPANLQADDQKLTVELNAKDAEGLTRARGVIDSHLARFAFREEFSGFEWKPAA